MKVIIDDASTNGDIIKTMFPRLKIRILPEMVMVFGENYEFQHNYPIEWWNAKYKEKVRNKDEQRKII